MNVNFLGLFGIISSTFLSVWAIFRYVLTGSYRLDNDTSKRVIHLIENESKFTWILEGEHVGPPKFPNTYNVISFVKGALIHFSRGERLLTAGWQGKEELTTLSFFRWNRSRVDSFLKRDVNSPDIPVMALTPHGSDRLGQLECDPNIVPYLDDELYRDIEIDIISVLNGNKRKTSCLLYGAPGNGKTQFVKYIARKYSLPINVVYLNPEYNNLDIAMMFSSVPPRSIVLLEDFDNYFDKRECAMKNDQVKFTFDAIINAFDGVHNDYRGNVFIMTANNIDRIDDSIKNRPSRFKYVREFGPPSLKMRTKILGDENFAKQTEGLSLDAVFSKKA